VLAHAQEKSNTRPSWTSPRGAAAFLLKAWKPARHGWAFGARVASGALMTTLRDLTLFRDPLYLKPRAWSSITRALKRTR
jgi:hypothetical protein